MVGREDEQAYLSALRALSERTQFGVNLGLQRIEGLLKLLGSPEQSGTKYIHVGGTNGKGSTAVMLAEMLTAAGFKTGFFSSPHLHSWCERFRIDGNPISKGEAARLLGAMRPALARLAALGQEAPTEFEVSAALAFVWFAEQRADWAVIEVGMGGEIDSTNVITPEVSVLTNVAMDHMAYLGNTPEEIAAVKAGIIKAGVPVVTAAQGAALDVLERRAGRLDSPLYLLGRDFACTPTAAGLGGQTFDWRSFDCRAAAAGGWRLEGLRIGLLGEHQLANASLAIAAARLLGLPEQAVRRGLAIARWPGRLELIQTPEGQILLDGAHNTAGMRALAAALRQYWPGRRIVAVLGMLADKERAAALRELLPLLESAVITRVPNYRAGDWQSLGALCEQAGVPCRAVESVPRAVDEARRGARGGRLLLITGSLYMLAEARAYLLGIEQEEY